MGRCSVIKTSSFSKGIKYFGLDGSREIQWSKWMTTSAIPCTSDTSGVLNTEEGDVGVDGIDDVSDVRTGLGQQLSLL